MPVPPFSSAPTPQATFTTSGKVKQTVYNVKDAPYNAVGDGVTDDTVAIQAAYTAADAAGGGVVFWPKPASSYLINTPITVGSNTSSVGGSLGGVTILTTMSPSARQGVFNINNKNNVSFTYLKFSLGGNATAITSFGHDNLYIGSCEFSGTTTGNGVIQLSGQFGLADMQNTVIEKNRFVSLPNSYRTINLFPYGGYQVRNTTVSKNYFKDTTGPAVYLDAYEVCRNTLVEGNTFLDIQSGSHPYDAALAVHGGLSAVNYIYQIKIVNNYYKNTLQTSPQQQGFAFLYCGYDVSITNNNIIGSWTPIHNTDGPAIAPGRVDNPLENLVITGNIIRGFNSAWDADSMRNVEVANNLVHSCGNGFFIGYGIQDNINIHDNVLYNSISAGYPAGFVFGNSNPKKVTITNNIVTDDRKIQPPTVAAALGGGGSLTVATPYYYRVTCLDASGETLGSTQVTATPTSGNQTILLTWNAVAGAVTYKIYRSTTTNVYTPTAFLASSIGADYADTGAVALTTGALPSSSTVTAPLMQYAFEFTGNYNFADCVIRGNRFYLPNSTFTATTLKELGSEVMPRVMEGTELHDSGGVTYLGLKTDSNGNTTSSGAIASPTFTGTVTLPTLAIANSSGNTKLVPTSAVRHLIFRDSADTVTNVDIAFDTGIVTANNFTTQGADTTVSPTFNIRQASNGNYGYDIDLETAAVGRMDTYVVNNGTRTLAATILRTSGFHGILKNNPSTALDVNGTITATGAAINGTLTMGEANNFAFGTTTGTKIGTATTQKLGFFNATPIVQEANTIDLGTVLSDLGLRAAGTAYPLTTTGAVSTGSLTLGTAGNKLNITTGSNASAGTGTLTGGTVTISTTAVTASSLIFLTDTNTGIVNIGVLTVSAKTAGTSFVVTSSNALDTSTFNWLIIN